MLQKNVLLKNYSRFKIGGPAKYLFQGKNTEEISRAVLKARKINEPIFILGGGTNVLFRNGGFDGLVINPAISFIKKDGFTLRVGAGISIAELLDYSIENSLSGLEWAGGLPGTVGGAIYGNAGAFKGEMKDSVIEIISLDISEKKPVLIRRKNDECGFGYRSSVFKELKGGEIIIEALFRFKKGNKKSIREAVEKKIRYREERQPLDHPNIGSIFKNVNLEIMPKSKRALFADVIKTDPFPVVPAAFLIAQAGLKGISCGGAMISPKHPNFIVNVLEAKSADVENLMDLIKFKVKNKFGIVLEKEVIVV